MCLNWLLLDFIAGIQLLKLDRDKVLFNIKVVIIIMNVSSKQMQFFMLIVYKL